MASAPISFNGLATGMDWAGIVSKLMTLERQPLDALNLQQSLTTQKRAVYSGMHASLDNLSAAVDALRLVGGEALAGVEAGTTTAGVATVSAHAGALASSASLTVTALASSARSMSTAALFTGASSQAQAAKASSAADFRSAPAFDPQASLASQSSSLSTAPASGGSFRVNGTSIAWSDTDSLTQVLGRVNAAGVGVTATYDAGTGKVSLASTTQGAAAQLSLSEDAGNLFGVLGLSAGTRTGVDAQKFDATLSLSDPLNHLDIPVTAGVFSVNGVPFYIDPSQDSLSEVLGAINASSAGVRASVDPLSGRVQFQSSATGAAASLTLGAAGDSSNFLTALKLGSVQAGTDAQVSVDGGPAQSLADNSSDTLVPGVTVKLTGLGTTTVSVGPSGSSAASAVQALVDAYNASATQAWNKLNEKPIAKATDPRDKVVGAFIGDSLFLEVQDSLLEDVVSTGSPLTAHKTLDSIGLSLTSKGLGQPQLLSFDQGAFKAALQSDPESVHALIEGGDGLAEKLHGHLRGWLAAATGSLDSLTRGQDQELSDLTVQIRSMTERMDQREASMTKEFSQLESLLGGMQARGSQLVAMLTKL